MFSIWFVSTLNCQRINSGIWILLPFEAWSWSWLFLLWAYCFPRFLSFNVWLWLTAIDFNWRLLTLNDETAIDLSFSAKMQLATNKKICGRNHQLITFNNALTASARDFSRFFGMFWDFLRLWLQRIQAPNQKISSKHKEHFLTVFFQFLGSASEACFSSYRLIDSFF